MPHISEALVEFARHHRMPPAPGIDVIETPRYRITLQPDLPIPGPNSISWIRCRPGEADEVIAEARATVAQRHLAVMWVLDPETQPADFVDHLARHGIGFDSQVDVMVLPIDAEVSVPKVEGLDMRDALADPVTFRTADDINCEAFRSTAASDEARERRRISQLAAGNRRVLLATLDGEPAGTAGISFFPPAGAIITGGAVRPKFRGRGIYRGMVAARLQLARRAGVSGLAVWGGDMSAPILSRLGFQKVGWRRFYLDVFTA